VPEEREGVHPFGNERASDFFGHLRGDRAGDSKKKLNERKGSREGKEGGGKSWKEKKRKNRLGNSK